MALGKIIYGFGLYFMMNAEIHNEPLLWLFGAILLLIGALLWDEKEEGKGER